MTTTANQPWPEPAWLSAIPDQGYDRARERVKFFLSLACLYHSQQGKAGSLASAIGMTSNAFAIAKSRGQVTPEMAIEIEKTLGRELFPRELFRPDLFVIE